MQAESHHKCPHWWCAESNVATQLIVHKVFLYVSAEGLSNICCQYATELLQIIFTVLIDAISTVGKNGQQILSLILKQIKINAKLLTSFTTSGRVESSLINHVQV